MKFSHSLLSAHYVVSNALKMVVYFIFLQVLTESAFFGRRNRLFGAELCSGSGTEFRDLVTSLVVFTQEALKILSCFHLGYSRLFFMLSIPTSFPPCDFWSALTVNSHHKRWRAPKCVASPNERYRLEQTSSLYISNILSTRLETSTTSMATITSRPEA